MLTLLLMATALALSSFDGQQVRDQSPEAVRLALENQIIAEPQNVALYVRLASLQEQAEQFDQAEQTLIRATGVQPDDILGWTTLAAFYERRGQFEKAVGALNERALRGPQDSEIHQRLGAMYSEHVLKNTRLTDEEKRRYLTLGVEAEDRALAIRPDYVDAMVSKNILLRLQANVERDPATRTALMAQADEVRDRALEFQRGRPQPGSGLNIVDRPPSEPAAGASTLADLGLGAPIRVGGNVPQPAKLRDVRPVYPPEALAAGVQGLIICEATINAAGEVADVKILRGNPLLDQAAIDAIKQWVYAPTLLNGKPVPVIVTVTVNFVLP